MRPRIEIINSCDQDWQSMKSLDGNKYCDKCQKKVIDFTRYSKREIIEKLEGTKEICGKLNQSQIEKRSDPKPIGNHYFSKMAFFISIGSVIGLTEPIVANPIIHNVEQMDKTQWQSVLPNKAVKDSITIKGKITDSNGLALPGTNILLKNSNIGTQSNQEGEFILKIPIEKIGKTNFLVFSFIGFKTKEFRFYKSNKYFNIQLTEDTTQLGGIAIVQDRNIFDKVGYFFHNLFSNHKSCN